MSCHATAPVESPFLHPRDPIYPLWGSGHCLMTPLCHFVTPVQNVTNLWHLCLAPVQTLLHYVVLKGNKLKDKRMKIHYFFFEKVCCLFIFLSLLLTVTSLERSLRSLGTSNDTQELQDGLWVSFELLQISLCPSLFIFFSPHLSSPFFLSFFYSWTLFCQAYFILFLSVGD